MYDLLSQPWLPTTEGPASLHEVLSTPAVYGDVQSGHALTDAATLRLLVLLSARGTSRLSARNTDLYGETPFMQVPPSLTAELARKPIHSLDLSSATGRDVTLLSRTLDAHPHPHSPAEAALLLLTFQAFAPSRGLSAFNPSKDAPHARSVTFHATGDTLAQTLALNTPPGLEDGPPPPWEVQPDWAAWRTAEQCSMNAVNLHAHPWRSVTLWPESDLSVRWVSAVSGVVPHAPEDAPWPDPHAQGEAVPEAEQVKRGGAFVRLKNPQSREVMGALAQALRLTLLGDPLAPYSFRRALEAGAARVRAAGLITRSGQPVALHIAEAELPWPTLPRAEAVQALLSASEYAACAVKAGFASLKQLPYKVSMSGIQEGPLLTGYWSLIWPHLSLRLVGQISADALTERLVMAAEHAAISLCPEKPALIKSVVAASASEVATT